MLAPGAHVMMRTRSGEMKIQLAGTGTATIDWGDGSEIETRELLPCEEDWNKETALQHRYPDWSPYNMTITGENITHLDCGRNHYVVKLDVSKNTALKVLLCGNNRIRGLDVSQNTALTRLDCSNNRLKALDVSLLTALENLNCSGNELTVLDVSLHTALEELNCGCNPLTTLDVSRNALLTKLECYFNPLKSLDVSRNAALTHLECWHCQLTTLNVSQNTALEKLKCSSNPLTALNVSRNTALKELDCCDTLLTELDVSQNTALTELGCRMSVLKDKPDFVGTTMTMTTTSQSDPDDFSLKEGRIPPPNADFDIQGTGYVTIDWGEGKYFNETVRLIEVKGSKDGLGATKFTKHFFSSPTTIRIIGENVTTLRCSGNQLTNLDVNQNTSLTRLECQKNLFTAEALNALFSTLPVSNGEVFIFDNPGTDDCDASIAENKGWKIIKEWKDEE